MVITGSQAGAGRGVHPVNGGRPRSTRPPCFRRSPEPGEVKPRRRYITWAMLSQHGYANPQRARSRQRRQLHQQRRDHRGTRRWTSPTRCRTRTRSRRAHGGTPTEATERIERCRHDGRSRSARFREDLRDLWPLGSRAALRQQLRRGGALMDENRSEKTESGNAGGLAAISGHHAANPDGWQREWLEKGKVVYGHQSGQPLPEDAVREARSREIGLMADHGMHDIVARSATRGKVLKANWLDDWRKNGMRSRLVGQQFNWAKDDDVTQNTPAPGRRPSSCQQPGRLDTGLGKRRCVAVWGCSVAFCHAPLDKDIVVVTERFVPRGIRVAASAGDERHEGRRAWRSVASSDARGRLPRRWLSRPCGATAKGPMWL